MERSRSMKPNQDPSHLHAADYPKLIDTARACFEAPATKWQLVISREFKFEAFFGAAAWHDA
jgi:hypothetical protein